MIVRVFSEGQFRLPDSDRARFDELDHACVAAVEANDERRFHETLDQLLAFVRAQGDELADDDLSPSDVMLPPHDTTLEEARREFTAEGLIPE